MDAMSKSALIAKYEALPVPAQRQVEAFMEFLADATSPKSTSPAKRRFNFDWAGSLEDLNEEFTAVALQHRINQLR
jgi:hypothetical protein